MLSPSNEITTIKEELEIYSFYNFATDTAFETALKKAAQRARDNWMIPIIGDAEYTNIATLDYSYYEDETCDTTLNSGTITCDSTSNYEADMYVTGPGIPIDAKIGEIVSSTSFSLASGQVATATFSNTTLTITKLTDERLLVYRAEVEFARAEFYKMIGRKALYRRKASIETQTEGGMSFSTRGLIGPKMAAKDCIEMGKEYLINAGYDVSIQLQRGNSFFHNRREDINAYDI